jgi:hypothetical protein
LVELCGRIHQIKYRSRAISRRIAAEILETEDLRQVFKLRDLASNLNETISCSVDIAQLIEVIVLEYA